MSAERMPGRSSDNVWSRDNMRNKKLLDDLLEGKRSMRKGDVFILGTEERITITRRDTIEGISCWRCDIQHDEAMKKVDSLMSHHTLKDYIEGGRIKEFIPADEQGS